MNKDAQYCGECDLEIWGGKGDYWHKASGEMRGPDGHLAYPKQINDLRVWHIPQIPGKPFYVKVDTVEEGQKICNILAEYDIFQFENRIKPDFSNANGITRWEEDGDGGWGWFDVDIEWEEENG